jgi:hypothetical protein
MPETTDQALLDALLDSWGRNNIILLNLLRPVPERGMDARALKDSPTVAEMFAHIHYMNLHYDHPILLLQHMLWHEGYRHGQIKLALKIAGHPISDKEAGPGTWGVWMRKTLRLGPSMNKLIALAVALLMVGMSAATLAVGQDHGSNQDIRGRFVGAWRLVSLEQEGAQGKGRPTDSTGLLVFTRDGHMSVQVIERNAPAQPPAGPEQYSHGGYEASFGTYEIDERTHTFIFHVEGALVRTLIGKDLPRAFEFSGNQLIVKSTRTDEHWRVAWERY